MKHQTYDLPLQLQLTAAALSDFDNRILTDSLSIGLAQYKVLASVDGKTKMTQKHIAASLDQTEASISRQVATMYEDGLIKTEPKQGDRRVRYVNLTTRGKRIKKRAESLLAKQHRQLFSSVPLKQRNLLEKTLSDLNQKL